MLYSYDGPVTSFNLILTKRWQGTTRADTDKKAKSNLAYQFKRDYHLAPNTKITLPEQLVMES